MRSRNVDIALLILRVVLGLGMMAHGSQKLFGLFGGHGWAGTKGMVTMLGFHPDWLWAVLLIGAEFGGGLLLVIGLLTRFAAASIIIDMLVAIWKVHGSKGYFIQNGGFEYPLLIIAVCVALMITGAGELSLDWLLRRRKTA